MFYGLPEKNCVNLSSDSVFVGTTLYTLPTFEPATPRTWSVSKGFDLN